MKTYARPLILLLAAGSFVASLLALYVHYQFYADPAYTSFCDVSETVSCEAVLQSRYASIGGIPVAAGGAIWAALVLLLAWRGMGAPSEGSAAAAGYIFVLSTVGLVPVLYLGYASFFVLQKMCLLCVSMYGSVAGIFVVSGAAAPLSVAALPGRAARDLRALMGSPAAVTIAAIWLVGSVSLVAFFPRAQPPAPGVAAAPAAPAETLSGQELAAFETWLDAQPRETLPIARDNAAVLVVKFNDYQCPACRQTHLEYQWIVEKYRTAAPGRVKFVTLDFPLEAECNLGSVHPAACEAAAAVRLAREKNRGEAMEEWLFQNQSTLTRETVKQGLRDVANVTDFDARYPAVLEQVRADAKLGRDLDINGTPTFFINGIKFNASLRPIYFDAAIAHELEKAQ